MGAFFLQNVSKNVTIKIIQIFIKGDLYENGLYCKPESRAGKTYR